MPGTCIIINPNAGAKGGITVNTTGPDEVKAAIAAAEFDAALMPTARAGHATELTRQALANGYATIVAAGGDGTVREVIAALLGTDATLGILPLGSAMNTARALGIPQELPDALRLIMTAERVERIDIGTVRGQLLVEAGGVGVSAGVFHLLSSIDAGRWDRLRTLVSYLRRARITRMTLEADGQRQQYRSLSLVVANSPFTGARVTLAPGALMNDGLFDARVFLAQTKPQLAAAWLRIILGHGERLPEVVDFKARTISVTARRPLPAHADDVLAGRTPTTFELKPGAIPVIVGPEAPALAAPAAALTSAPAAAGD